MESAAFQSSHSGIETNDSQQLIVFTRCFQSSHSGIEIGVPCLTHLPLPDFQSSHSGIVCLAAVAIYSRRVKVVKEAIG